MTSYVKKWDFIDEIKIVISLKTVSHLRKHIPKANLFNLSSI